MPARLARRSLAWVGCALLLLIVAGCKSTKEHEDYSDRPWNAPRGWEHGLPPGMYDRR